MEKEGASVLLRKRSERRLSSRIYVEGRRVFMLLTGAAPIPFLQKRANSRTVKKKGAKKDEEWFLT